MNEHFLYTLAAELIAKSSRIQELVSHSGTLGSYREQLLIVLLNKYLPDRYLASSGFIEGIPNQIDIIIFDKINYVPLFNEEGIKVVCEESVRAIIEVKTTLYSSELESAIVHLSKINAKLKQVLPIFKGIFGFDTKYSDLQNVINRITNVYNDENNDKLILQDNLYGFVDAICIQNKCLVGIEYVEQDDRIEPFIYSLINEADKKLKYTVPYFLSCIFAHLEVEMPAKKQLLRYFDSLMFKSKYDG